jgi:hypothetical protein
MSYPKFLNLQEFLRSAATRRLVVPILVAALTIVVAERAVESWIHPTFWEKTSWILHDPYKGEGFDRLIVMEKLSRLLKYNPDIISVGDSSGFFSLQPTIINRYLPGKRYANLSTGANQAFDGYKAIAEFALKRTPSIKYVVLHMFPQLLPAPTVLQEGRLSPLLQENFVSFRSWLTPPSAALSPYIKTLLFDGRPYKRGEALSEHKVALEFRASVEFTQGWTPEHDIRFDRVFGRSIPFYTADREDWSSKLPGSERSTINYVMGDFARMVESYGAKLIVAFGPIPEGRILPDEPARHRAEQEFERFQKEFPSVVFLFPMITQFTTDKFAQFNHIAREYTFISSKRMGVALRNYFENPQSVTKFIAHDAEPPHNGKPEIKPMGEATADLREAAMAYFLYTATADASYRDRISDRVLELVDHDKAFGFMMDDAKTKIAQMAESRQKLSYSIDHLTGTPVDVKNIAHCNSGNASLQWVQLSGAMTFTYDDPERHSAEPVAWPSASNIVVPTIIENGVRKFDGYCPEPSMAAFSQE